MISSNQKNRYFSNLPSIGLLKLSPIIQSPKKFERFVGCVNFFYLCKRCQNEFSLKVKMASRSSALIILLQLFFVLKFCNCDFATDYLANYVNLSDDDYENKSKCWTEVCMLDSGRLIYSADHDSLKSDPCGDFPSFAMGEFLKHRVPSERYPKLGFRADVEAQFFEEKKRILNEPVKPDEPNIFKVIKSFFKKCINSSKFLNSRNM